MAGNANSGGRNAKSTISLVASGTYRPDRHGDSQTPQAPAGVPVPPRPLKGLEQAEWDRTIVRLQDLGTLSTVDDASLYQYVKSWARTEGIGDAIENADKRVAAIEKQIRELKRTRAQLMKAGAKLETPSEIMQFGSSVAEVARAEKDLREEQGAIEERKARLEPKERQGRDAIRRWLVEHGLTPSARTRVKVPAKKPAEVDSRKERFFGVHSSSNPRA